MIKAAVPSLKLLSDQFKAGRSVKTMKAVKDALMIYFDSDEVVIMHTKGDLILDSLSVPDFNSVKIARGGNDALIILNGEGKIIVQSYVPLPKV